MSNEKVVATLWMLVAVTIVCIFATIVSEYQADQNGSYTYTPRTTSTHCYRLCR